MKKLQILLASATLLFLGACSSSYHAGTSSADDVYYSSKDYSKPKAATYPATPAAPASEYSQDNTNNNNTTVADPNSDQTNYSSAQDQSGNTSSVQRSADYSSTSQYQDEQGTTYVTNNYYNDDYYDYSYSSRLRRYYSPAIGYSYYDPYYTNSYYYDYYPSSWGVSIYSTYKWWGPSY